jgi:uncharacterized protein (TIGR03084 family)
MEIFEDLAAEQARIEALLGSLDDAGWAAPSAAPGWSVTDVVLHLAQTEEAVIASTEGRSLLEQLPPSVAGATSIDDVMERWVAAERAAPAEVFERWRQAHRGALAALRAADPDERFPWAAAALRPTVLATTRLAEHWAHALDITGALGLEHPDTEGLWHIAWLAHRSLPYAFSLVGQPAHEVRCALTGPGGKAWSFGETDADSVITGPAGDFCRVGAQRLEPEQSRLVASGPHGEDALRVLRNYAA